MRKVTIKQTVQSKINSNRDMARVIKEAKSVKDTSGKLTIGNINYIITRFAIILF